MNEQQSSELQNMREEFKTALALISLLCKQTNVRATIRAQVLTAQQSCERLIEAMSK